MSLDFTAIDFETANRFRSSACALGAVRVRSSQVVEQELWLMRPPEGYDHFEARNVRIHGLTPAHVAAKPRFAEIFDHIKLFLGSDVLVAHNAAFDMGVLRATLEASGHRASEHRYLCSLSLSRRFFSLDSFTLARVASAAGVPLLQHHNALADARACALITTAIGRGLHADTLDRLCETLGLHISHTHATAQSPSYRQKRQSESYSI